MSKQSRNPEIGEVFPLRPNDEWKKLSGALPIRLTNDYMFRALLQSDNDTLKELVAALLHMDIAEVSEAVITNPIMLGQSISDKYFVLDVRLLLNGTTSLDLEMQVVKKIDWTERSIGYLCRLYDDLNRGQNYVDTKPAIQIDFLDFSLFENEPEFYATYKMMNVKRPGQVYTEKFRLSAVDLTRIDLATEEDKRYRIDDWARMFKAKTWEELAMLAEKNRAVGNAISGIYQLTEEERIMEQCRQREDFMAMQEAERQRLERFSQKVKDTEKKLLDMEEKLSDAEEKLSATEGKLSDALREIERLKTQLASE